MEEEEYTLIELCKKYKIHPAILLSMTEHIFKSLTFSKAGRFAFLHEFKDFREIITRNKKGEPVEDIIKPIVITAIAILKTSNQYVKEMEEHPYE